MHGNSTYMKKSETIYIHERFSDKKAKWGTICHPKLRNGIRCLGLQKGGGQFLCPWQKFILSLLIYLCFFFFSWKCLSYSATMKMNILMEILLINGQMIDLLNWKNFYIWKYFQRALVQAADLLVFLED